MWQGSKSMYHHRIWALNWHSRLMVGRMADPKIGISIVFCDQFGTGT